MKKISFEKYFKRLGLKKNDKIYITSNIINLLVLKKKNKIKFELSNLIDDLIKVVGSNGTILVPTFNWRFCEGYGFDYRKTLSNSGSLGNYVLKRKDFKRTKNPIYSFCIYGKDKNYICNMKHKSCFEFNSPWGYMVKNNCKNLYIDVKNIYEDSFTLCHVAEQNVGVNYRYLKKFTGPYIHQNVKLKKATYTMYVRKLNLKIIRTRVNPIIKRELVKKKSYIEKNFEKINFKVINMKTAFHLMSNSIKYNKNLIYPEKS